MKASRKLEFLYRVLAISIFLIASLVPLSVSAQDVAVGGAKVEVLQAISISSSQALNFGDIYQGVPKAIANSNGTSAGIFSISGESQAGISLFLQLPQYLTLDAGGDQMTVVFGAADASIDSTGAGNPATMAASKGWQNVDPASLPAAVIIGSTGTDVYLGATAIPKANQRPGSYSGEIVLRVDYNGL